MANKFAWASIDENGKISGGKAGNQSGRELVVGRYYNFGQNRVIRFKNVDRGRLAGKIAKKLAKNKNIGYDQSNRASLFNLAKKCKWDYKKLIKALKKNKVETDCSAFVSTVIDLAYGRKLIPLSTTSTIADACKKTKKFKTMTVANASRKWHKGDMPLRAGKHIIINV